MSLKRAVTEISTRSTGRGRVAGRASFRQRWGGVLLLAGPLLLIGFWGCGQDPEPQPGPARQPTTVAVHQIQLQSEVNRRYTTYGSVQPPRQMTFQASLNQPLAMIRRVGDQVAQGGVLARFDTSSLQQSQAALQNALGQAGTQAEHDRLTRQLQEINRQIEVATIVAPFDLIVKSSFGREGVPVEVGQALLHVVEQGAQRISASVPSWIEQQTGRDQQLWVEVDGVRSPCQVEKDPAAPRASSNVRLFLTPQSNGTTPVTRDYFQAVHLRFEFSVATTGCWIPTRSLIADGNGQWSVLAIEERENSDGRYQVARRLPIEVLWFEQDQAYVSGNLEPDGWIIHRGTQRVVAGQAVTVFGTSREELTEADQLSGQG